MCCWLLGTRRNAVLRILSSKILVNAAIVSLDPSPFTTVAVVPPQQDCILVQSRAANKAITVPVTWLRLAESVWMFHLKVSLSPPLHQKNPLPQQGKDRKPLWVRCFEQQCGSEDCEHKRNSKHGMGFPNSG